MLVGEFPNPPAAVRLHESEKSLTFFGVRVYKTAFPVLISRGINSLLMIPRGKALRKTRLIVRDVFQGECRLEELIAPLIMAQPALNFIREIEKGHHFVIKY